MCTASAVYCEHLVQECHAQRVTFTASHSTHQRVVHSQFAAQLLDFALVLPVQSLKQQTSRMWSAHIRK